MCEVTIDQGKIRGSTAVDFFGSTYFTFQGIPYAKPPTGDLRFKAPQEPEKWTGIFDATKEGDACISRDIHKKYAICGGENCLVLNVYTKQFSKRLPILFWIHGGAFIWGSSASDEYGPDFLISEDVVVVSINYRLGLLGFLSLEDNSLGVPGNAGLKDMVMALKWVQKNITSFGGDPENVTIFGQSAGGASVNLLVLSPMTKGLFHKAIAQSGCALNPWVYSRRCTEEIAKAANLKYVDDNTLLQELRLKTIEEIFEIQERVHDTLIPNELRAFGFIVEKNSSEEAFLSQEPIEILKNGNYNHVPFMTGFTTAEAICFDYFQFPHVKGEISFEQQIPWFFGYKTGTKESQLIGEQIREFYYGSGQPLENNKTKKFEIGTDVLSLYGIYETARLLSRTSKTPVYLYQVSIESKLNFLKQLIKSDVPGVCHCDELGYLFKNFSTPNISANSLEEVGMKRFLKLWTNFATYGNPTPVINDLLKVEWKPVKPDQIFYLVIGEELVLKTDPEPKKIQFWKKLFNNCPNAM